MSKHVGSSAAARLSTAPSTPRPEHPRPDAFRANWLNLNGEWQFEADPNGDGEARGLISGKDLAGKITVPFCIESRLSGIGETEFIKNVWYRRSIDVPDSMKGKRLLLHFGAVDYKTWVYVNGTLAGTHVGGSAAFCFDITKMLKDAANELVVRVFDDARSGLQPLGKQATGKSEGCVYTRTTGIWQTVWLEAVGSSYIENVSIIPDPDHARILIEAKVSGANSGLKLTAEAFAEGNPVGSESSRGNSQSQRLIVNLSEKKLWEPGSPFLYDLKLSLTREDEKIDELQTYFGLRKVTIDGRRILINDKPIFQRTILDQGFYPDGIWSAPTDEALKKDIELSMDAGFNGARLHQKVFEPRFLYWADKLGYLVWGEFPNWGYNYKPEAYALFIDEWTEVLLRDRNHPSIIGWCPFNESNHAAGELQRTIFHLTKALDPTRPALETSGWTHTLPHPEMLDSHDYDQNPQTFRQRWRTYFSGTPAISLPPRYGYDAIAVPDRGLPYMVSEFGGIGWAIEDGWGYGARPKTIEEFHARYQGLCDALLDNPNFFGFCYTQLTDVEQERNGLYYYDRTSKFDVKRLHAATSRQAAYERAEVMAPQREVCKSPDWKVLVGAVQDGVLSTPYRYSTEAPEREWAARTFKDSAWRMGLAPFGPETRRGTRTAWSAGDLYLRKTFVFSGGALNQGAIVIAHDQDSDVYINGQPILSVKGVKGYEIHVVTEALRKALKQGTNTLALHARPTTARGQYIDLALLVE